jgi:hypothetical protein
MDPGNPVVQLCAAGMAAEGEGRPEEARALFERAWAESRDDFEACIAAHYVARRQATAEAQLEWNARALERADLVADERVRELYPSLYLNLAHSLERVGRTVEACALYSTAAARLEGQADTPYLRFVRLGISAGRKRVCPAA